MSDKNDFLAAIVAAPEDYNLRRVYADWLDEHDEPEEADRQRRFEESDRWLRGFAAAHSIAHENLINGADRKLFCFADEESPYEAQHAPMLWWHLEIVTGKRFDESHRESTTFRCACSC